MTVVEKIVQCRAVLRNLQQLLSEHAAAAPSLAAPQEHSKQAAKTLPFSAAATRGVLQAKAKFMSAIPDETERQYASHPLQAPVAAALALFERAIALLCRLCEVRAGAAC
jgi:hypothetical protein